jgi:hypothetical protein
MDRVASLMLLCRRRRGDAGVGGSEEAVVYLARQLALMPEFHVEVYTDPLPGDIGVFDGVAFYPSESTGAVVCGCAACAFVLWS